MKKTKLQSSSKTAPSELGFPEVIIRSIRDFLRTQLEELKKQKKNISGEDPFKDVARVVDNAAPDTEADEQFGHARVRALKTRLNNSMVQVRRALTKTKTGTYGICEQCGKMIDTDRLMVYPEATLCIDCERAREARK